MLLFWREESPLSLSTKRFIPHRVVRHLGVKENPLSTTLARTVICSRVCVSEVAQSRRHAGKHTPTDALTMRMHLVQYGIAWCSELEASVRLTPHLWHLKHCGWYTCFPSLMTPDVTCLLHSRHPSNCNNSKNG